MNKMRFHKVLSLVLVLVLAGSILAGCGSSNSTPASGAASTSGSQGTQGSQAKDSLNVVTYADPIGVFPLHVDYSADKTRDGVFFQQVYDTLFRLDAEGNPEPWLATEYEVSEDGLE